MLKKRLKAEVKGIEREIKKLEERIGTLNRRKEFLLRELEKKVAFLVSIEKKEERRKEDD